MRKLHLFNTAGALIALTVARPALADGDPINRGYYGHMWDVGWGIMGAGSMILFWVLAIALVAVAVRWLSQQDSSATEGPDGALALLQERLAKGDIDVAEFEQRKKALQS